MCTFKIAVMNQYIDHVLLDRQVIAARVAELAGQITTDLSPVVDDLDPSAKLPDRPQLHVFAILDGSMIFLGDLVRQLPFLMRIHFLSITSYPGKSTISQGPVLNTPLPDDLNGTHVLIIEDIIDSGSTLRFLNEQIREQKPASLNTCVLLRKPTNAPEDFQAEYVGFDIPDKFIVGYGLDYGYYFRNLPDIVALKPEAFE